MPMKKLLLARILPAAALAASVGWSSLSIAPLPVSAATEPGWPCVQRKVPELSLGALWAGPEIDPSGRAWQEDAEVRELVNLLAVRRTPMQEAEAAIKAFAQAHPDQKQEKLTAVFTGLFQRADSERRQIIEGIGRFQQRQSALAEAIRQKAHELTLLEQKDEKTDEEEKRSQELQTQLDWDTRIFELREQSLTAVCESPTLIEQRLFALSRAIQGAMQET